MCCQELKSYKILVGHMSLGTAYFLLLEFHIELQHVKGSEKSRSKDTNPVFTETTFPPKSATVNIRRELYSGKHYLREECSLQQHIYLNQNDTERISVAPAQG